MEYRSFLFRKGEFYPHSDHEERISKYKVNKDIFYGDHWSAFGKYSDKLNRASRESLYLACGLPNLIAKKSADFLFGDSVQVSAGNGENTPEQEKLNEYVKENNLNITFYESALTNSFKGDNFMKVRWAQQYDGKLPPKLDPYRIIIENVNSDFVFPETCDYDQSKIIAYHVAYPIRSSIEEDEDWLLNVESHYAGYIEYSQHYLTPFQFRGYNEIDTWKIGEVVPDSHRIQPTQVPFPLIVHTPNFSIDSTWHGLDEYSPLYSLFAELDNRLRAISETLDLHASPILGLPSGSLELMDDGTPSFDIQSHKLIELHEGETRPEYITWGGSLSESLQFIQEITNKILAVAELPSIALGGENSGTSGSSTASILYRMNSIIAKTNRKKQYYEKSLSKLFMIAMMLEKAVLGPKANFEVVKPHFTFKNGLPRDLNEESTRIINLVGQGLMSKKSAITFLFEMSEEEAEKELKRIEEEWESESTFADPSIFRKENSQSTQKNEMNNEEDKKEKENSVT
jgi:hypothetical protein